MTNSSMTALNKQALRESAQEEIMLRSVSDTSDAWQDEASPEVVLSLLDENLQLQRDKDSLEAAAIAMRDDMREAREKLEAVENNLLDSECHVAELEESLRDKQALLEAAEKRIAELSASHSKLREGMAAIYNAICENGASTSLSAILTFVKRSREESATAAGIGVKGE